MSFEVRAGEIFGVSGLIGAGRTELMRLIYGADLTRQRHGGAGRHAGRRRTPVRIDSPSDAVRAGIALITEDRKGEGLLLPQPIAANVSLGNIGSVARHGIVDAKRENALAKKQIDAMRIRSSGPGADCRRTVGRQPAEGRDRPLARARLPRAVIRRT